MNDFQALIADTVGLRAEYQRAIDEYNELPPLPEGLERRETFVRFRIAPLKAQMDEIAARELAAQQAAEAESAESGDVPIYEKQRYQAPKLKGLEDIQALCKRNAAKARMEGVGAR